MKKTFFILNPSFLLLINLSFLFSEKDQKIFINGNNKEIQEKKIDKKKDVIHKDEIKNKNKYEIAGNVVEIIICIIIIIFFFAFFKNDSKKEEKIEHTKKEKEYFDFLKNADFYTNYLEKKTKLAKIFEDYQKKEKCSLLYIFYKTGNDSLDVRCFWPNGSFLNFVIDTKRKIQSVERLDFDVLKEISDYTKFYEQYRNKPVTEQNIKDYIINQNKEKKN